MNKIRTITYDFDDDGIGTVRIDRDMSYHVYPIERDTKRLERLGHTVSKLYLNGKAVLADSYGNYFTDTILYS